jgi:O-antigen ligase
MVLIVAIILVGIALLPYAVDNLTSAGGSLVGRVNYLQSRSNVQSDIRSTLWGYAWQHFLERPVFGTSIDLPEGGYPHNILLEAFLSTGAAGGGLVLFMMVHGLIRSYWLIRQDERRMWLALFYMQYLVLGLFSGALYDNWMFWCLYAAVISSTESLKRGRRGVRRR